MDCKPHWAFFGHEWPVDWPDKSDEDGLKWGKIAYP